jgi:ParB family chromosome partitioning protein
MPKPKGGLGRGLEALIPIGPAPGLLEVAVDSIVPNPRQPRQANYPASQQELADSIRAHGLLQPLVVTALPAAEGGPGERYQLIAGERRWAAARLAGLATVPVLVKEATPQETLELALVENLQRADLNPLEAAGAYRQLIEEFGLTQDQVADRVGKKRVTVANTLRLLNLPEAAQASLAAGEISEGHARALLALPGEAPQLAALKVVVARGLSVRQTEELVRRLQQSRAAPEAVARRIVDAQTQALEDDFRRTLGTKVELVRSKKGGKLVIHFYSEEELEGIYQAIVRR